MKYPAVKMPGGSHLAIKAIDLISKAIYQFFCMWLYVLIL